MKRTENTAGPKQREMEAGESQQRGPADGLLPTARWGPPLSCPGPTPIPALAQSQPRPQPRFQNGLTWDIYSFNFITGTVATVSPDSQDLLVSL